MVALARWETGAIKEGIRRWLMRNTAESWGFSGALDSLRFENTRNDSEYLARFDKFSFELWHSMDAYNWVGDVCASCFCNLWQDSVRELTKERAGYEWLDNSEFTEE